MVRLARPDLLSRPWKRLACGACTVLGLTLALACGGSNTPAPVPPPSPAPSAPAITAHPQSNAVVQGDTVTLSVTASSNAVSGSTLSYQWFKDGQHAIAGAGSATYTFTANLVTAGSYYVEVTNNVGKTTSDYANITVGMGYPVINGQPSNRTVAQGETATFKVITAGMGLSYQWKKDGVDIPGATTDSYTTGTATLADSGTMYSVKVTNTYGEATSNPAKLLVSLVENGGFETLAADGNASKWTFSDLNMTFVYDNPSLPLAPPLDGGKNALVHGWWSAVKEDATYQSVAIPADTLKADLTFVIGIGNLGFASNPVNPVNTWRLKVLDDAGNELVTLATKTDADYKISTDNKNLVWQEMGPFDLSAYKGLTIRLSFQGSQTDAKKDSVFIVDKVTLVTK